MMNVDLGGSDITGEFLLLFLFFFFKKGNDASLCIRISVGYMALR